MTFSLTLNFPDSFTKPVDVRQTFRDGPGHAARRGLEEIMHNIVAETPYEGIAGAYRVQQHSEGNVLTLQLVNDHPIWPFREYDTRPHWAPFGPGSDIAQWAAEHGIPAFLVARKIAQEGTQGNHLVARNMNQGKHKLWENVIASTMRWRQSYGTES